MDRAALAAMIDQTLLKPTVSTAEMRAWLERRAASRGPRVCVPPALRGARVRCHGGPQASRCAPSSASRSATTPPRRRPWRRRSSSSGARARSTWSCRIGRAARRRGRRGRRRHPRGRRGGRGHVRRRRPRQGDPRDRLSWTRRPSAAAADSPSGPAPPSSRRRRASGRAARASRTSGIMREAVGDRLGVKAAGGIRTLDDALAMIDAGASRLGTSAGHELLAALPAGVSGRVATYRARAVVLRLHKLGESDRIVTMLAADGRQIRAVAKGSRKGTSRLAGRLQPYVVADLLLAIGPLPGRRLRGRDRVDAHEALRTDLDRSAAAGAVAELAERLSTEGRRRAPDLRADRRHARRDRAPPRPGPARCSSPPTTPRRSRCTGGARSSLACVACGAEVDEGLPLGRRGRCALRRVRRRRSVGAVRLARSDAHARCGRSWARRSPTSPRPTADPALVRRHAPAASRVRRLAPGLAAAGRRLPPGRAAGAARGRDAARAARMRGPRRER